MRPPAESLEVWFPGVAAFAVRLLARAPMRIRSRVLADAFDRAERAFNRGDLPAVFALFADDVDYVPPSPLYEGRPLSGRDAVRAFWGETLVRFDESRITNLSIEETSPSRFVRTAKLLHRSSDQELSYVIRQTTELRRGHVARQVNELLSLIEPGGA